MTVSVNSGPRVVVIGTGPAGAAAALFLSRAGIQPLLIEAGPKSDLGFVARVRGLTLVKRQRPLQHRADITRVGDPAAEFFEELAPGGLSNHWACAVPRFSDEDFRDAARAGEQHTWPIDYADLQPWYDEVEPLLRIAAGTETSEHLPRARTSAARKLAPEWDTVARASGSCGRAAVVMPYANGASTMLTRSATAFNAFTQLVEPAVRAGQVEVLYEAEVLRLEWSASEQRVVSITYRNTRTGQRESIPCRAVVLAAGAINSAQIMLQSSSSDFPHGLGNQHDVLGRYLHDHPLAKLVVDLSRSVRFAPASYITRAGLENSPPLYAAAYMQWSSTALLARSLLKGHPGRASQLGFSVFGTMEPRRENFVALDPASHMNGKRSRILISLSYEPEALQTLERARGDLMQILESAGWGPRLSVWKVEAPGNSVHYAGTCRMHASPRFGVVDGACRVHGVPNVAIVDSSVFTTGPEKNPVLTAMALAARAGDRLAQDVRAGKL